MKKCFCILLLLIGSAICFSGFSKATEAAPAGEIYIVQKGDVLSRIAERFQVSVQGLMQANALTDERALQIGQRLIIPKPEATAPAKTKDTHPVPTTKRAEPSLPSEASSPKVKLSLEQAINRALHANRPLMDSRDSVEGAKISLEIAQDEFKPKIYPGASVGWNTESGSEGQQEYQAGVELKKKFSTGTQIGITPEVVRINDSWQSSVGIGFTQPLLRGISSEYNLSSVHGAEYLHRSARRRYHVEKVNTILRTVDTVYEIVRQREMVKLYAQSADRLRGYAYAARIKEKVGLTDTIDVFRSEIQVNQAEDALNAGQEAYLSALDNLKIILALPMEEDIEIDAPEKYALVTLSLEEACRTALANRVALKEAEDALREAGRLVRVAKHNTLPELNLVLNYSQFGRGDDFSPSTRFDEHALSVSLTTSTDISRNVEKAQYRLSRLELEAAERNIGSVQDEIIKQVKSEYRKLRQDEIRIGLQQKQIEQAEAKRHLAQIRFRWGQAGNFDLIESELELRRAQTALLAAELNYIASTYHLRAAMGTLLEAPKI